MELVTKLDICLWWSGLPVLSWGFCGLYIPPLGILDFDTKPFLHRDAGKFRIVRAYVRSFENERIETLGTLGN
jgi:hypothetical protein